MDACSLIYLTKANLFSEFMEMTNSEVVIDKEVYTEVIMTGKQFNYPDADIADDLLTKYQIPIIPTDINKYLHLFRDPGETSCYCLAKTKGTCITTDRRAFNKFLTNKVEVLRLDTFFYQKGIINKLLPSKILDIIKRLLKVNGTTPERYSTIMELLLKE